MAGKGKKQQQKAMEEDRDSRKKEKLLLARKFKVSNNKDDWDLFYSIMDGEDKLTEWYADWSQLRILLTALLVFPSRPPMKAADVCILVPGCGNSTLSEDMYDEGYTNITSVDYSKVAIAQMLRRNVRDRPMMKWRVMDMTNLQFGNHTFDVIVDKRGLDTLMKPKLVSDIGNASELGNASDLGNLYLSEVKRLLKNKGRYICITLAESPVLDLLFCKFRCWWKMNLYAIAKNPSFSFKRPPVMIVAEKDISNVVFKISSFLHEDSVDCHSDQVRELCEAFEREMEVLSECSNGSDILDVHDDLYLWMKGNLTELKPGRQEKLLLGEPGVSRFFYNAVLLDAQQNSEPFQYQCAVFLVPKMRARDWLFSSEEGQWLIVDHARAARLVLILLDSCNFNIATEIIKRDLSPLIKQVMPRNCGDGIPIRFIAGADGIKQREIVHQVTSALAGPIVVEDVMYAKIYDSYYRGPPSKNLKFRRLTIRRTQNLFQGEAVLSTEGPNGISSEVEKNKAQTDSLTRKKGKKKNFDSCPSLSPVIHNYLASSYHNGIICGLFLIPVSNGSTTAEGKVNTVVIGLKAGVLPMFMRNFLPALHIEVIELDPSVLSVARDCFGFRQDERLKVRLGNGIRFVMKKAEESVSKGKDSSKIAILIVDVDSANPSYSLTCPKINFVEESFLSAVESILSDQGLFIINLVSRSFVIKTSICSRLKAVFSNVFSLELEEDMNEVIFATKSECAIEEDKLSRMCERLTRAMDQQKPVWGQRMIDASKNIKQLK